MKQETILIVGASGTVGSLIAKKLRDSGANVKESTSRKDVAASSSQKVFMNLATGENIHEAFSGIDKAFLISPPGYADQYAILSPMIQEAKRRGLKKVVLMTAMGANAVDSTPFRRAEIELEKSGLTYNIIRPNWFFQNFNTFWVHGIKQSDLIALPAKEAKTSFIDAEDIANVAAKLLTVSTFDNQDFDLTGPQALTHGEVADAISKVTGRKISYENILPETLAKTLLGAGLPKDYVDFMILIFGFLAEGYNSKITESVKLITGLAPRNVNQYTQGAKQHFAK